MAFTMNKLFAGGNLVRDPELRYIPSGSPVCTFDLALNRAYTTQAGEKREDVCFLTVVVWGKQAETCGQHLAKVRDTAHRERQDRSIVNTPIAHRERSVATRDRLLSARASPPFAVRVLLA
jgi:primosomal replication protein N